MKRCMYLYESLHTPTRIFDYETCERLMAIKLRDIATKLNLSPSLVSGVLNDRAGVWASEETRERIRRTARELGYRPHAAARALRSGKTNTVALVYINPADTSSIPYGQVT